MRLFATSTSVYYNIFLKKNHRKGDVYQSMASITTTPAADLAPIHQSHTDM
jgi:putative SOS response-associated peptidase YedK